LASIHAIIGTAGHIDHGKTALVRALTGIDTDRLEEEKRRGISIDLGFAHLALEPGIDCGLVDVPGHERFVKNMLAGVGGIDLVLLVIASDESVKPQTREHFDICRLLGITRGIVVLTKCDLVDSDLLELVKLEAAEFVAGSFLEKAPMVAVSSVTGEGLGALKSEIARLVKAIPRRSGEALFRLPIDRAFSMRGFGAVVTGTMAAGSVQLEQEVEVLPIGRKVRVRGVQVHGKQVDRAFAGQRTALNLTGIDHSELHRGMALAEAGKFSATKTVDAVVDLLPSAKPLKHRAPVHFHAGTAELEAEVRLIGMKQIEPGTQAFARIALREPSLLLPGDRFILRMFSPVVTIAGGVILDPTPPRKLLGSETRLQVLHRGTLAERLRLLTEESKAGLGIAALVQRTGLPEKALLPAIPSSGIIWLADHSWAIGKDRLEAIKALIQRNLSAFHKQNALQPGLSKEDLRSRVLGDAPSFLMDAVLKMTPAVTAQGELLRLTSHKLALKGDEEQALEKITSAFAAAGLQVPASQEVLKSCGVDATRARSLLQILLREKRLVKITDDLLFHPDAIATLRGLLASRKGSRFGVPEFKDWTGVSRKYAIPLLEFLDRERVTRREGDTRVIL
jgi:selenocysteine-specific elongation factor